MAPHSEVVTFEEKAKEEDLLWQQSWLLQLEMDRQERERIHQQNVQKAIRIKQERSFTMKELEHIELLSGKDLVDLARIQRHHETVYAHFDMKNVWCPEVFERIRNEKFGNILETFSIYDITIILDELMKHHIYEYIELEKTAAFEKFFIREHREMRGCRWNVE